MISSDLFFYKSRDIKKKKLLLMDCLHIRLHLPAEVVPATHRKAARPAPSGVRRGGEGGYRGQRGDRDEYRRKDAAPRGMC